MTDSFRNAWTGFLRPMLKRPRRLQVAALCYTRDGAGRKKVLLITSRDTGRWILPKGWPITGMDAPGAAKQEAWEEAGVKRGHIAADPIGTYTYDKELSTGLPVPVETLVYPLEVTKLKDDYPEAGERRRTWVSPEKAANMVNEPELQALLRRL